MTQPADVAGRAAWLAGLIRHPSALLLYAFLAFVTVLVDFDARLGPAGRSAVSLGLGVLWFAAGAFWCVSLGANVELRGPTAWAQIAWTWWVAWAALAIAVAMFVTQHEVAYRTFFYD
jgi:hypothetical protein